LIHRADDEVFYRLLGQGFEGFEDFVVGLENGWFGLVAVGDVLADFFAVFFFGGEGRRGAFL
jgi:hypothetical protein